jgi:phenylacetate-CoA ligase
MKTPTPGTIDTAIPISLTEGISWPALPSRNAVNYLAIAQQLEDSQWWPPEMLLRRQFTQLAELLAFSAQTVPFYGRRLEAAGFRSDKPFTSEIWQRVPVLTLDEVRAAGPDMASAAVPPQHGEITQRMFAGDDGAPMAILTAALADVVAGAVTLREAQWDERNLESKLAVIATPDSRPPAAADDWGMPFREIFFTGPGVFRDVSTPVAEQAAWLEAEQPGLLATTPDNLAALVRHCRENNLKFLSILHLRTMGLPVSAELRAECHSLWDTRLFDGYVSAVAGAIAYPCPDGTHHHIHAERALVEILDHRGQPCDRGQPGRVVVTPLHAFAMPLIRLDVGDVGIFGPSCRCGRGLPVLWEARRA